MALDHALTNDDPPPDRADRHARLLNRLASTVPVIRDLPTLKQTVTEIVAEHFNVNGVVWADVDHPHAPPDFAEGGAESWNTLALRLPEYLTEQARAELTSGLPVVVQDVAMDPRVSCAAAPLRRVGIGAFVAIPFAADASSALFCVYTDAARRWHAEEVRALGCVAEAVWPVLERVRTQHALTVSEERFTLATRSTGVGVYDYDVAADRSYWSPEMCDIRGVPVGTTPRLAEIVATVHEDDRSQFRASIAAAFDPTGPGLFADEFRVYRLDTGAVRWVTNSGQALFDGTGNERRVVRVVGIVRDITDRKIREAHDQFVSDMADAWIRARDVLTLLQVTADGIRRHLDVTQVSFIDVAPGASSTVNGLSPAACEDLASGWCVVVHDVAADARTAASSERLLTNHVAALIDVPFRNDTGLTWVIRVASSTVRGWRIEDVRMLEQLVSRFSPALERARAEEALRHSEARQAFVLRFNDALRSLSDPDAMQQLAATMLCEHLQAYRVSFSDVVENHVIVRQYCGAAPLPVRAPLSLYPKALLEATARGELVAVSDIRTDPRLTDAERAALLTRDYLAFVGVVRLDHGRKVAALAVRSDVSRTWSSAETDLIRLIGERTWDAVERVRAQTALQESEERLRSAIRNASIGIMDYDVVRDCATWSPELCALVGVPEGHSPTRGESLLPCHPEDRARIEAAVAACLDARGSGVFAEEFRVCRADTGEVRWLSLTCQTLFEGDGAARRPIRTIGAARDVTRRKIREARDQFLLELNDALRSLSDASQVQSTASRLLGQHLQVNRVGFAEVADGRYSIRHEYADGVAPNVAHGPVGTTYGAALANAYRRGEPVVVNDVQTDPRFTDAERVGLRARDIAAFVGVTLVKDGRLAAAFGANHSTPRVWTRGEIDLVRVVAERMWEAAERARVEEALRASEHKLRLSLQAGQLGIWRYDLHTRDFEADALGKRLHGLQPEIDIGGIEDAARCLHPDDVAENQQRFARSVSEGVPFAHEYRVVLPSGETRWIGSLGMVQADTSSMYGIVQDVTVRKQAELALQEHGREQENTLRLLLETAGQAIVLFDGNGAIVTANRACETIFGWSVGELLGNSIEELLPPRLVEGCTGLVGRRRDGTTFPVEISLNHVVTRDGARAMAFVTDISTRRQAEQTLQERSAQLERQAAQLRRLASDLTLAEQRAREHLAKTLHDGLQQLLFAVSLKLTQLEHAAAGGVAVPSPLITETRVDVEEAINAARSLSLDLFPAGLIAARLSAAVRWLATWVRSKYGLFVEVSADPLVEIERKDVRTLLLESLRELLLNVVKHADVDAVSVDLARDETGTLIITVADEGKGFDATALFDIGVSSRGGLGIFSIRERLALLGGRLEIESAAGRGTSCRLVVPAAAARDACATTEPGELVTTCPLPPGTIVERSGRRLRVLVVDDHPATVKAIRQMLAGLTTLEVIGEAGNGVEAIGLARTLRPDVIIMDISMPEMNGVEATRRIHLELPDIHIVGLSSYERGDGPHPIEEVGASGYFRKGVDNQQLIEHLVEVHAGAASSLESA